MAPKNVNKNKFVISAREVEADENWDDVSSYIYFYFFNFFKDLVYYEMHIYQTDNGTHMFLSLMCDV